MAKLTKFELDSQDFSKSLDMPDFDFSIPSPKDDGSPIVKIGKAVGRGFISGVLSSDFLRNTLSTALPRGYGSAIDYSFKLAEDARGLYDNAAREIRPQMQQLARITGRVIPKDSSKDSAVMRQLRAFANTYEEPNQRATVDPREQNIAAVMGQVFQGTVEADNARERRQDAKDNFKQAIEQHRHKDILSQLDAIRIAASKTAAYTTSVNANFQRKSLELQYRHYFLAMDALVEAKRSNAEQKAYLEGILRNTALPEQAKLTGGKEKGWQRNRFLSGAAKGVFSGRGAFLDRLRDSVKGELNRNLQGALGAFRQGLSGADMLLDARDLSNDLGMNTSITEMLAENFIGGGLANRAGQGLGNLLKPWLEKNQRVRKFGNDAQRFVDNPEGILKGWARGDKNEGGPMGILSRFLKRSILGMGDGVDRKIERDNINSLQQPATFDRSVARSITDVIPGYLARILRELRVQNTGDDKEELIEYDLLKNKFNTTTEHRKSIMSALVPERAKKDVQWQVDRLIKSIGGDKLTPKQKRVLGQRLLGDNVEGVFADRNVLTSQAGWQDKDTKPYAKTFSKLFSKHFAGDDDNAKLAEYSGQYGSLGRYVPDQHALIQQLINNGQYDFLVEQGIIDESGKVINDRKLYSMFLDDGAKPGTKKLARGGWVRGPGTGTSDSISAKLSNDEFVMRADVVRRPGMLEFLQTLNDSPDQKYATGGQVGREKKPRSIIDAIRQESVKAEAGVMIELLNRIATRVEQGVLTFGMSPEMWTKLNDGRRTLTGRLKDYLDLGWNKGMVGQQWLRDKLKAFPEMVKNRATNFWASHGDRIKGWRDTAMDWGRDKFDQIRAKIDGLQEVWVEGESEPRLLDFKIRTGQYIDMATGKVIKSWRDIGGDVADIAKPKKPVLLAGELQNAYVKTAFGRQMITKLGAGRKWLSEQFGKLLGGKSIKDVGRDLLDQGIQKAWNLIDGPDDVYVKGDLVNPVLLKSIMEAGGYFDRKSGKVIKRPTDITGPVQDVRKKIVLTTKQITKGLVNGEGKAFKTAAEKIGGIARGLFSGGLGFLTNLPGKLSGLKDSFTSRFGNPLEGIGDFFKGFFNRDGIMFSGSKKITNRLDDIYELLLERLPKGKNIRVGSVEDLRRKRKAKKEEEQKAQQAGDAKQGGGWLGKAGGVLGGLFGRKKDKEDKEEKKDGLSDAIAGGAAEAAAGGILGTAGKWGKGILKKIPYLNRLPWLRGAAGAAAEGVGAGAAAAGAAGAAGAAKKSWLSRLMPKSKLGKGLGAGLALGAAGSLANASGHTTLGGVLDTAGTAATGWSLASGAAGLLGIEGGALGLAAMGGGALLSALGAIASAPITLPALAIAGSAYGAYKLFQFATRDTLDTLSKVRYAQYGFLPTQPDYVHLVFQLEDMIKDAVVYDGGQAGLQQKKVDWKKCLELFSIDTTNQEQINNWTRWFVTRFKPVFLVNISALNAAKPGAKLSALSKLTTEEKKKYFQIAKYPSGPYGELTSPIPGMQSLPAGPQEVTQAIAEAQAELDKAPTEDKAAIPTTEGGAAMLQKGARTSKTAAAQAKAPTASELLSSQTNKVVNALQTSSAASAVSVFGSLDAASQMSSGRVTALSAIRFKTYGLREMETDKVTILNKLESVVGPMVKFNGAVAGFNGDPSDVLNKVAAGFGVDTGTNSSVGRFMTWFKMRFLPTYLNYRTALKGATGKDDETQALNALKAKDMLNVASTILTTNSSGPDGSGSVWKMSVSPWKDYDLNAESSTTDGNMQGLKNAAKETKVPEETAYQQKPSAANDADKDAKAQDQKTTSLWDKVSNIASKAWEGVKSAGSAVKGAVQSAGSAVAGAAQAAGSAVAGAAGTAWDAVKSAGSAVASGAGKVVTAAAGKVKDALLNAAKIAGLTNPVELAMFLAQMDHESGGFKFLSENLNYKPETLMKVFGKYFKSGTDAQAAASAGPEAIANRVYGGRMGNTDPGDGFKYRGRGVIQLTGKANYAAAGQALGLDLINNPDLASDPDVAAKIAIWYWRSRPGLAQAAQQGDVTTVTKAINGGTNGLADRQSKFQSYLGEAKSGRLSPGSEAMTASSATTPSTTGTPTGTPAPGAASGGDASAPTTGVAATGGGDATPSFQKPADGQGLSRQAIPMTSAAPGGYLGGPSSGGFNSADMTTSDQLRARDSGSGGSTQVTDILSKSYDVQSKMLDVLTDGFNRLADIMSAQQAGKGVPAGDTSSPTVKQSGRNMTQPAISLARKTFA